MPPRTHFTKEVLCPEGSILHFAFGGDATSGAGVSGAAAAALNLMDIGFELCFTSMDGTTRELVGGRRCHPHFLRCLISPTTDSLPLPAAACRSAPPSFTACLRPQIPYRRHPLQAWPKAVCGRGTALNADQTECTAVGGAKKGLYWMSRRRLYASTSPTRNTS